MTPGVYDLEICQADDDWYVVDVEAGDTVSVRIDFTHAAGDLDLELFDGNTLVGLSETIRNNEALTYVAPADTTIGIRVYGYQAAANTYTLDVSVTAGVAPTLTLSGDTAPAVGSSYTWEMESDYANDSVVLVVGDPGGAINVPGCANTVLHSNIRVISATTTDAAGLADVTRVLPAGLAVDEAFWAVSRDLCVVSEPLEVSFQSSRANGGIVDVESRFFPYEMPGATAVCRRLRRTRYVRGTAASRRSVRGDPAGASPCPRLPPVRSPHRVENPRRSSRTPSTASPSASMIVPSSWAGSSPSCFVLRGTSRRSSTSVWRSGFARFRWSP